MCQCEPNSCASTASDVEPSGPQALGVEKAVAASALEGAPDSKRKPPSQVVGEDYLNRVSLIGNSRAGSCQIDFDRSCSRLLMSSQVSFTYFMGDTV